MRPPYPSPRRRPRAPRAPPQPVPGAQLWKSRGAPRGGRVRALAPGGSARSAASGGSESDHFLSSFQAVRTSMIFVLPSRRIPLSTQRLAPRLPAAGAAGRTGRGRKRRTHGRWAGRQLAAGPGEREPAFMFRQEQPLAEGSFAPMGSLQPDAGNASWNGTEAPGGGARVTPYSLQVTLTLVCLAGLLMLLTVFGNVLVIIAVFTSRALKAPQNLFLVSLASADILVATLVIPFSLANEVMGYWYFGKAWCEIYLALDVLFCTSSIVHLCAISLDRYWSITQAIEYNLKRTPRRIKAIIFTVWVISAVISFPPLISIEKKGSLGGPQPAEPRCEINDQKWYVISSCIGSFFAPCLIMILVYVRIYQIAKRRTRVPPSRRGPDATAGPPGGAERRPNGLGPERGSGPAGAEAEPLPTQLNGAPGDPAPGGLRDADALDLEESSSSEHAERPPGPRRPERGPRAKGKARASQVKPGDSLPRRGPGTTGPGALAAGPGEERVGGAKASRWRGRQNREKRFTFVLAVVIGVFVVCWFPFFFTYTLTAVGCSVPRTLFKFFFWFGYCNSSLNPVIYTIFNHDFRRAFKKILCRGDRKRIV